jgi:hypothetical protein
LRHSPHDAQDFTQGFFLRLIEHKTLIRADPLKGKLRSFLVTSFNPASQFETLKVFLKGGLFQAKVQGIFYLHD